MDFYTLDQAAAALEAGRTAESQKMLAQIVSREPNNEEAWLWLAEALEDPVRKRYCIQRALTINPASEVGHKALAELNALEAWPVEPAPAPAPAALPAEKPWSPPWASLAVPVPAVAPLSPAVSEAVPEPPVAKQLDEAIRLIEAGKKDDGLTLLERIVERDPRHEMAWLWLAATTIDPYKKRVCLDHALEINPKSRMGRKLEAQLQAAAAGPRQAASYWGPGAWVAALAPSPATYASILSDAEVSLRRACKWVAYAGLIGFAVTYLEQMLLMIFTGAVSQTPAGTGWWAVVTVGFTLLCGGVVVAGAQVLSLLASGGVLYFIGLVLGGAGSYTEVVYAMAAYLSPLAVLSYALIPLPGVGRLLAGLVSLYGLVLNVVALKVAHRFGWFRALATTLAPSVLVIGLIGLLVAGLMTNPEIAKSLQNLAK